MPATYARTIICLLAIAASAWCGNPKEPVDYVSPYIGGIAHLLVSTSTTIQLPYGMMRIVPITTPGITDRYLADKIYGFPAGGPVLMPATGQLETSPDANASFFDRDLEIAMPYYYAVTLEKYNIHVELTVTERAAYYQFSFPEGQPARVIFTVPEGGTVDPPGGASISGQGAVAEANGRTLTPAFFYAEFSQPVAFSKVPAGVPIPRELRQKVVTGSGIVAELSGRRAGKLGIRVGMSHIGVDQARRNLAREIPGWHFETTRAQGRKAWNDALGKIAVKGGTEEQRTMFYTALYRTMERPANTAEEDRYYSPGDKQVHPAGGRGFYPNSGGFWGSHRSLHPLQLLLEPQRQVDQLRSFLALFDQTGRMMGTGRTTMIGHHIASLVLDAYTKGHRDFDVAKAFEGLKKNAMEVTMMPWHDGPLTSLDRVYVEKGFFPALAKGEQETVKEVDPGERRQAVSVTLEAAYDDWCTAQVARLANRPDDYAYFMKRAYNYKNVFDPRVGFMAPKTADGSWKYDPKEFDPIWLGGAGGRDYYTEMNAWTYTFYVPHDIAGLASLMGGRDKLAAKLDGLFAASPGYWKYRFFSQFPDMTGLIGLYAHGNEPSFHIPYLYNYVGEPWKTQRRVRQIMTVWYTAGPLGISGDEDRGEQSSWYVWSAMGFYPVCPGRPVYDIGSPIFEEARIMLPNGKTFTIEARNASAVNKYVQSATLNGRPWNKPWFEHRDLAVGGTLVLVMGPRPVPSWGSAADAAPPSMSR